MGPLGPKRIPRAGRGARQCARAATCKTLAGLHKPASMPCQAAVTPNVKPCPTAGLGPSAGAQLARQLTGVSWKRPTPGLRLPEAPDPRGPTAGTKVPWCASPRCPQQSLPSLRGAVCTPFRQPAPSFLGYRKELLPRTGSQAGTGQSAGVQTIIYLPLPNPPPAGLAGLATGPGKPAGHAEALTFRSNSACRSCPGTGTARASKKRVVGRCGAASCALSPPAPKEPGEPHWRPDRLVANQFSAKTANAKTR